MQLWFQLALWVYQEPIDDIMGPIFILLIFCALAWFGYRRWRLRYGASRWTLTEATIQSEYACNPVSTGMAVALGGTVGRIANSNTWNGVLQYSYYVAGESYPGYLMLSGTFGSRQEASAAAAPWLLKKIMVRYNPSRPYESAFLPDDGAPAGLRSLGDKPPASSEVITLSLK